MKKAIVVGTGAGGATIAKELQGTYDVTILEAGKTFKPFSMNLSFVEKFKKTRLLFNENLIQFLFPAMRIRKTNEKMVLVNGQGLGGTTTISAGNALRMDNDLKKIGINLDAEFEELYREIPVTISHQKRWGSSTKRLFEICIEMELNPQPIPKMGNYEKCTKCGRCILGCPNSVKWDSRKFLEQALDNGAKLEMNSKVKKVILKDNKVIGVESRNGWNSKFYPADLVILSAGGFASPAILANSGIKCQSSLFVDPVLCIAAEWKNCNQIKEITMPFAVQKENFIISPYFDYLSYFFNKSWKFSVNDTLSLMVKLADSNSGSVMGKKVHKSLTTTDKENLNEGVEICTEIFSRMGVKKDKLFFGTINAGHPGGMLPLTFDEAETFHHSYLPENLYVADASLFPNSLGNPPIFTIMAMAKRIAKICTN